MKIKDAKPIYYANRKELVDQMRRLTKQKEEAEKKYSLTGESRFSEEAATLELSLNAEYAGELPDIEIPEVAVDMGGGEYISEE